MRIAILTRPDNRSPKVLAISLQKRLQNKGVSVQLINDISFINRLVDHKISGLSYHFWIRRKLAYYFRDRIILQKLRGFDAVIICETIPNIFITSHYNIEKLRQEIQKPVGLYAVFYIGNAPTQLEFLKTKLSIAIKKFDFHLSVSNVTEVKSTISGKYFPIGINAQSFNLKPLPKKEIIALIDFAQPGYEHYRATQIQVLKKLKIKYISLEKEYSINEIREIYQCASLYFMQSSESFGLPVLECLVSGCQIFTPESWWPMSWRLNEHPEVYGWGELGICFSIYHNEADLERKLLNFMKTYDFINTPLSIFNQFTSFYTSYYYGNETELDRFIKAYNTPN